MLLTIGMIVKNEEKYLERCLNGIKPILEQVDSELIIADTGSTDRTVEIAKQFTDNVFYFEWIKDFAAARNSTLEKAQGEWFMFVDADEIFESCDEIIHFFNSGEYKKYNSASYIQRNILHASNIEGETVGSRISDFAAPRMTKILPNTIFIYPVHENLSTYGPPEKALKDAVIHYGYSAAMGSEEKNAKMRRNLEILQKRLETEKESSMLYLQLYESSCAVDAEMADKYLEKGLEFSKKIKNGYVPVFMAKKLAGLFEVKKFDECISLAEEYFALDKKMRPGVITTDVDVMAGLALSYYKTGRYSEAVEKFIAFFKLFLDFSSGRLVTAEANVSLRDFARNDNIIPILNEFAVSCIYTNQHKLADEWIVKLPVGKYSNISAQLYDLAKVSVITGEYNDFRNIGKYYENHNDVGKREFIKALKDNVFAVKNPDLLVAELIKLNVSGEEEKHIQKLYKSALLGEGITEKDILETAQKFNLDNYPEMLYFAIKNHSDISFLLSSENFDYRKAVIFCYSNIRDFHNVMEKYSAGYIEDKEKLTDFAEFLIFVMAIAIAVKKNGASFISGIDKLFEIYADIGTEKSRFAKEITESRRIKNYKTCFEKMRGIIEASPEMTGIIAEYKKGVTEEYEATQPMTEMQRLAAMIKSNIRNYVTSGNTEAAAKTLAEYEKINPSDPEISELREMIR